MDAELIISDEYVQSVGRSCKKQGYKLESILDRYTKILTEIRKEALMSGDIAIALSDYITCVNNLNSQLKTISADMYRVCEGMIEAIDKADSYLF